jgi:uncharacterized protein with PIN domain
VIAAAGYDTVIAEGGKPDRELARRCAGDDRILLTKDRHLAATAAGIAPVVLVKGKRIDETARALRTALDIDWQHAPFSRCKAVKMEPVKVTLCEHCDECPQIEITDQGVTIGEDANTVRLLHAELVRLIKNGELQEV